MIELCQELIWIEGTNNIASTYCMRPRGHSGKHNIAPQPEDFPERVIPKLSKEEILTKKYGPYGKDDERAKRGF